MEQHEDTPIRKLAAPERNQRHEDQVARLKGVSLLGDLEIADALLDVCCAQYDENRVAYIPWEKCLKKSQELLGAKRDASIKAEVATDLQIRQALQCRGLAYDQSGLLTYAIHEQWVDKMFYQKTLAPPHGYAQVSFEQLRAADQTMFTYLSVHCRSGIVPTVGVERPMDLGMKAGMVDWNVCFGMMPMPASSSSSVKPPGPTGAPTLSKKQIKGAKFQLKMKEAKEARAAAADATTKGKGKGKGAGRGPPMPRGLENMFSKDKAGNNLCYGYNLGSCTAPSDCGKGLHGCCQCQEHGHPQFECPHKKKP